MKNNDQILGIYYSFKLTLKTAWRCKISQCYPRYGVTLTFWDATQTYRSFSLCSTSALNIKVIYLLNGGSEYMK